MGFISTSEQLSGKEISIRLFGSPPTCGRMRLWRRKCYRWWWKWVPSYQCLSNVKLLPPQVSPAYIPLVARFSRSVEQVLPGWAVQPCPRGRVSHAMLVAGAAEWLLRESCTRGRPCCSRNVGEVSEKQLKLGTSYFLISARAEAACLGWRAARLPVSAAGRGGWVAMALEVSPNPTALAAEPAPSSMS